MDGTKHLTLLRIRAQGNNNDVCTSHLHCLVSQHVRLVRFATSVYPTLHGLPQFELLNKPTVWSEQTTMMRGVVYSVAAVLTDLRSGFSFSSL